VGYIYLYITHVMILCYIQSGTEGTTAGSIGRLWQRGRECGGYTGRKEQGNQIVIRNQTRKGNFSLLLFILKVSGNVGAN